MCPPVMPHPVPCRRRGFTPGFTLVELLVVLGVIGLLIALLLPAVRQARYQAKLADCSAHLHHIGSAVMAYAADHDRWYPYRLRTANDGNVNYDEPWWIVSEPGANQVDDRKLFRPYMVTVNYLRCPLEPEPVDLEDLHGGKAIVAGYELWFGRQLVRGDAKTNMFRAGQRPRYNGRTFRVLAADVERWAYWWPKLNSGHPDRRKLTVYVSNAPDYADPSAVLSMYHFVGGVDRGAIDRNFLMDDGSVVRMTQIPLNEQRLFSVPYIAYAPESTAAGRLPAD